MAIRTEPHDEVRLLVIDNPPVNALGAPVRQALLAALEDAERDPATRAVVITGAGRLFSGGADITEFTRPPVEPMLPALLDRLEASPKPIVAAIHGSALGGGLELSLACHYRVADAGAKLGLPEVKLGLLPGAGGTQRLPRLIGLAAALSAIVGGEPLDASEAHRLGLVDRLAGRDTLVRDAIAFAREVAIASGPRRTGERPVAPDPAAIERFLARDGGRLAGRDAPAACLQSIRNAAELPFAQGLAEERALFARLAAGRQSQALRHLFFAERQAAKIDDLPAGTEPLPVARVGVVGAGTMGGGIAMNFLSAGIPVTLVERDQAPLDRGVTTILANYERTARRGRLTDREVEAAMALLTPSTTFEDLAGCDLVIEAVFEDMAVKQDVFRRLDAIARPGAILATNTSYLDIDRIAAVTGRASHVLGLHFFSPANVMRLLEIVRADATAPAVLATASALARRIGKIAVVARVCHGFIGNRMLEPRQRQANALLLEGAAPSDIDDALLAFGMPMGPLQMADLAGLDLGWDPRRSSGATIRELLCEAGRRGQKTRAGFYDYDGNRVRTPSAAAEAIIRDFAARRNIAPRAITPAEIRDRLLFPMVNEAARILEEGIAQRPSDIDVVWVHGYGWPAITGGPLFWADAIGLDTVVAGLEAHRERLGEDAEPSRLLAEKAGSGGRFY